MPENNHTTKKRNFKHLTLKKRGQIEILLKTGMSKAQIAQEIGISRSTLYDELRRGTVEQIDTNLRLYKRYFADVGQRVYQEHRSNSRNPLKIVKAYEFIQYAEQQIKEQKLCPDTICGEAKVEGSFETMVCAKTLYNYIDMGLLKVRNIDLPLRVRRKIKNDRIRENRRLFGKSIEERPEEIAQRQEPGHWEIDTIIGKKGKGAVLLVFDERVTRKRHIIKIKDRSAESVNEGIQKLREIYGADFSRVFLSITSDNGSEFAHLTEQLPETTIYYAHPYASFERGTNEKQNSLVRRFFPKGCDFNNISDEAIRGVEDWINNLPRKIFNYKCANDLFSNFYNCPI